LIVIANIIFLKEKIHLTQGAGAFMIIFGAWLMLS
jgi:drug/metabolite transporter (DMT)-like permease